MEDNKEENNSTSNSNSKQDEISLLDLFAVLLKHIKLIVITCVCAAVFAVGFSILSIVMDPEKSPLPNKYTSQSNMLINDSESSQSGLSSILSSSSLSSLVGGGISSGFTYSSLAVYLISSNSLLDAITDKFDLINKWKIEKSPRASSRKMLKKLLKGNYDSDNGIFTVSFEDIDPAFAKDIVNFTVEWIESRFAELGLDQDKNQIKNLQDSIKTSYNEIIRLKAEISKVEDTVDNPYKANVPSVMTNLSFLELELTAQQQVYTQLKSQYELEKINIQSKTPVFQILEYPEIPDQKSSPSRGKLCIIIVFAAGFLSIFAAFLIETIEKIRNDPKAMDKLKNKKRG